MRGAPAYRVSLAILRWPALAVGLAACASSGGSARVGGVGGAAACAPGASVLAQPDSVRVAGGWLYGTRLVPEGARRAPLVILLAGSGPIDRNGNGGGALPNTLRLLAEGLAQRGVGALSYDRRGVGASAAAQPSELDYRFSMLVDDAGAWVRHVRDTGQYGPVVLAGHSEGALVAILAAQASPVDAVVSLAGPGRPYWQVIRDQLRRNITPAQESTLVHAQSVLDRLARGEVPDSVSPELNTSFRSSLLPYLASFYPLDPAVELKRLRVPVLVVQGTTDLQVEDAEAEMLAGSTPGVRVLHVDGMNHALKLASPGRFQQYATYTNPRMPVVPLVLDSVAAFVCRLPAGAPSPGH